MSGVNHTDLDATPRGPSRSFAPPEVPDSPRSQSTTSSQPSLTSRSSKRSRRSEPTSPSKRAFLRTIPRSINIHAYDDSAVGPRAPLGFKELVEGILDIAEGLKTVPQSLQEDLADSERSFRRSDVFYTPIDSRTQLGTAPTLSEVDRIVHKARELREDADSEAAWNCFVHGPLGSLAESRSTHSRTVCVKNV
ncbi:hypothetical protein H2203_005188 [Taxawa tesnikishii (nom. ined.)]|nr:hypothetical protein H2203_005188 [Dothideales sp. JES 119]